VKKNMRIKQTKFNMKTLLQKDVDIIVMSDNNEKEDDTLLF
jgi:hypothetical protein